MTVTNSEIGAFTDAQADIGTPASGDELLIYDVSTTSTKKVLVSGLNAAGSGIAASTLGAKGSLVTASAASTPAELAAGADGTVPTWRAAATDGIEAKYPPGHELDYVEFTANVSCTATTAATANTIVTGSSITCDGTALWVEFYTTGAASPASANTSIIIDLWEDSTDLGEISTIRTPAAALTEAPVCVKRKRTPSAGAHTYTVKGWVTSGTGTVVAGAGGAATAMPGYIRVTKA